MLELFVGVQQSHPCGKPLLCHSRRSTNCTVVSLRTSAPFLPCPTLGNAPRRTDQLGSNSCPRGSPDAHLPLLGSAHKVIPSVSVRAAAIRGCGDSSPPQPVPSTKLHERGGDTFESPEKQPTVQSTHCKAVVKNAPVGESQRNRAFAEAHDGVACLHSHGFKPTSSMGPKTTCLPYHSQGNGSRRDCGETLASGNQKCKIATHHRGQYECVI